MANSQTFTFNIKAVADMKDVQSNIQNIQNALKQLKLPESTQNSFKKTFGELEKELDKYQKLMANGFKTKSDATALEKSGNNILRLYDKVVETINSLDNSTLKKAFEDLGAKEVENLKKQLEELQNSLKTSVADKMGDGFKNLKQEFKDIAKASGDFKKELNNISSSTLTTFINNLSSGRFDLAEKNFESLKTRIKEVQQGLKEAGQGQESQALQSWINKLSEAFNQLKTDGDIAPIISQLVELKNNLKGSEATIIEKLIKDFQQGKGEAESFGQAIHGVTEANREFAISQAQAAKEIDQIKSRIQYFFGLSNAINLVKRAIRGAFDTIKELDAAMTETAVVTDFSVSDMWAQLPEYTKRANELGVTTLAAYEAATLYYQQGLKTNEVNALSVETLKMARIAGLDAAEATDRMTNALRGFNMELTEANAQRVDDVYSELAANTASNVDEISTAMTKVASLAHNANADFETTAAFLAQIIETTRESAETAGTALKTVYARFTEVKSLVDEGTLRGTDEEGQAIDVNKVGAALRTAGIDLNRYFLGEVGINDIFMELASKWDSLTTLQQRYIATQAAGSRQQSRFIALMSDYARTQELVGKAYNANGASARQFAKTQESLASKLARLKNAWNEFLMGLTNNTMVKTFVDLLTDLLNAINKVTNAFGDGTNTILKWGVVAASILGGKTLFKTGGILDNILGAATQGTMLGSALGKIGIGGKHNGAAKVVAQQLGANAGEGAKRTPLIFGSGSLLSKGAKGLWNGAQNLGGAMFNFGKSSGLISASGISGIAAGLTGIATAFGAVAAAAGVAYTAYQLWLKLSPKGQLKQAELYASAMDKIAENTKKTAEETRNALEKTQEFNTALNNASTPQERKNIIQNQNEYISSLLEQDATYAKYLHSTFKDGQLILTLDENKLALAADKAAEAAVKAAAGARFAQAAVSTKQAQVYESELRSRGIDLTTGRRIVEGYDVTSDADTALWTRYSTKIAEAQAAAFNEAQSAYAGLIDTSQISDETAELMSSALAEGFGDVDLPSTAFSWLRSRSYWQNEYLKAYGTQADSSLKTLDIARAVKQQQQTTTRQEQVDELTEKLTGAEQEQYKTLLQGLSGEIDLTNGELAKLASQAAELDKILGKTTGTTKQNLERQQQERQTIRQNRRANIYEQALRSGMQLPQLIDLQSQINNLDFEQLGQISDIITNSAGDISQQTFEGLFSKLPSLADEELGQIQDFFGDFDLNDPIDALQKLRKAQEEAADGSYFKKLLADIEATNPAITDAGNLVQNFFTSSAYDELSDSISKFIEENGRITGDNIEELASSCDELETILDNTTVTAEGLAEAFNLFEQAKLPIDAITTSLLEALSAGESFDSLLDHMESWVEDFDAGESITKGSEHIVSQVEEAMKYVENWQFGDEPIQNIYDHLFGEGKYDDYLKEHWGEPLDQIETYFTSQLEHINHLAENQGLGALQELANQANGLNITSTDGLNFKWDLTQFSNTKEAIAAVADQLGVTEGAAESLIASWGSHFWDLRQDWDELNLKGELTSLAENIGESGVVTEATLSALGASLGLSADEVKVRLQEVIDKLNETREAGEDPIEMPIIVNWQDENGQNLTGDELINQFKKTFGTETPVVNGNWDTSYKSFNNEDFLEANNFIRDFQNGINGIDFTAFHEHLTEELQLSSSQADEIIDSFVTDGQKLVSEIEIPIVAEDGSFTTTLVTVEADSAKALQAGIEAAEEAAQTDIIAQRLADADLTGFSSSVTSVLDTAIQSVANKMGGTVESAAGRVGSAIGSAGNTAIEGLQTAIAQTPFQGTVILTASGTSITATGGIVGSYASGSEHFHVQPGTALTGEEDPEIVWNKEKGYAYITGQNGPEFQNLQPGDRVFNAAETKKILKNSSLATGGVVKSYINGTSSGGYKPPSSSNGSGGDGSSSSSKDKGKKESTWRNELDWLYDLMEDIAEYERQQTIIQSKYELALNDLGKTGRDLFNLTRQELRNLNTQYKAQSDALLKRTQQMGELQTLVNSKGYQKYIQWNQKDQTLEINWDKIEAIQDKEKYDEVIEFINRMEEVQDQMDDAEKALYDIKKQIQELEERFLQQYLDFQKRVLDAVVKQYQTTIDNLSELNDTLNDANSSILDSLQKEIDLQRQIRDNTDTEQNIADMEARLAYLQRDTTGANAQEIRELEKQLSDTRQDYSDTLIDQEIDRLNEANDAAATQREKQIELMQAQLDYWQESGGLWNEVADLVAGGFTNQGTIIEGSDLWEVLKQADSWDALSEAQKKNWANELILSSNEVGAHLIQLSGGNAINFEKVRASIATNGDLAIKAINAGADTVRASIASLKGKMGGTPADSYTAEKVEGYASGGTATSTAMALLHGTPQEPEYVLNARQTDAFLRLADILPAAIGGNANTSSNVFGGDTIFNIGINVDSIANDYDVDQLVERIKDDLADAAGYRNVNALSFIR